MADSQSSPLSAVTLDQLIALNDEIAALVRSGVPLESGLGQLGGDLPGRLGKITTIVAQRLERGESLGQILSDRSTQIPPVYAAVVEAGIKAGRLSAALESVARSSRQLAELRRLVIAGFVYPLLVCLVAWVMFVLFTVAIAPRFLDTFREFGMGADMLAVLVDWGESAHVWGPAVPVVVTILGVVWWLFSGRAALIQPGAAGVMLGWLPWMGSMLRCLRTATFTELLAILVEHDVPLDKALPLAAEAVGDRRLIRASASAAAALERGDSLDGGAATSRVFPPLLSWLMGIGQRRGALLSALRHASNLYRQRALGQAMIARIYLPILVTVAVGGSATLLYALLLFLPWVRFLHALS